MPRYEEGTFQSKVDGLKLFSRSWVPEEQCKAVMMIAHGFMEHCGRYERFATALTQEGFACYTFDHRSHGKSEDYKKTRALIGKFDHIVEDFTLLTTKVLTAYNNNTTTPPPLSSILSIEPGQTFTPELPIFVFGHSMGGLTVTRYLQTTGKNHPVKAVALSAPYLMNIDPPGSIVRGLLSCVVSIFPTMGVAGIKSGIVTRDPEEDKKYETDPLNIRLSVPAQSAQQFMIAHDAVFADIKKLELPLFIVHGDDDKLVNIKGSENLISKCACKEKEMKVYPGGYHELLNELKDMREEATRDLISFYKSKL